MAATAQRCLGGDLAPGLLEAYYRCNSATQPVFETSVTPAVDGTGYTLEAAIPWAALDVSPRAGQTLRFDLAVGNSTDGKSRSSQLVWNGVARNSSDRSAWGRLSLVP